MAENWLLDVQKYAPDCDPDIVAGLVRYCGIALQKRDSSLVAFSSPDEIRRVRENFLRKKLALDLSDSGLNDAIASVGTAMKGDRTKNRVTVYYLLAAQFDKLEMFRKAPKKGAASKGPATQSDRPGDAPSLAAAAIALVGSSAAMAQNNDAPAGATKIAPAAAASPPAADLFADTRRGAVAPVPESARSVPNDYTSLGGGKVGPSIAGGRSTPVEFEGAANGGGSRWWLWLLIGLAVIALFLLVRSCSHSPAVPPATTAAAPGVGAQSAPAPSVPALTEAGSTIPPQGSGVVATEQNNLPALKVYFDVGKADVSSDFAGKAGNMKTYLADHPAATLAVAGYNDPSGNAAANAALSKRRAQQVSAALVRVGVPAASISLEKPSSAIDTGVSAAELRRVEVTVKP